jgi:hypothetical protein
MLVPLSGLAKSDRLLGPFFIFSMVASSGNVPLTVLFSIVAVATGVTFGVMLPFLLLSFANNFYGERLKGLLHLGGVAAPPVITPSVPALVEAAAGT